MKLLKSLVALLTISITITSCQKEGPVTPSTNTPSTITDTIIQGKYKLDKLKTAAVGGYYLLDMYLYVDQDSVTIVSKDTMDFWGGAKYKLIGNYFYENASKADLIRKGNNIELSYDGQAELIFEVSESVPDAEEIISFINSSDDISQPGMSPYDYGVSLTAKDQKIYLLMMGAGGVYNPTIYGIDPNTKLLTDSIPVTFSNNMGFIEGGISYANGYFWVAHDNTLDKIDPASGISSFQSMPIGDNSSISAITFDGTDLLLAKSSNNTSEIFRFNITSNVATKILELPVRIEKFDFMNGKLIFSSGMAIHRCALSPFKVEMTYAINRSNLNQISGMTHFGNQVWTYLNLTNNVDKIARIELN